MSRALDCIAVLGVPGTGAGELMDALRRVLATQATALRISDQMPSQPGPCLTLLLGLNLPQAGSHPASDLVRLQQDSELRQQLQSRGLPYRVIYGSSPEARLANALHALGLPATDSHSLQAREQAQFDLNRGRTPWSCEKCSDPECEHRLFTGLLAGPSGRVRRRSVQ